VKNDTIKSRRSFLQTAALSLASIPLLSCGKSVKPETIITNPDTHKPKADPIAHEPKAKSNTVAYTDPTLHKTQASTSNTNINKSTARLILPPRLTKGSTIAITAPASPIFDTHRIIRFQETLKDLGFNTITGATLQARYGYLAGRDVLRAQELNALFANHNVHGIIAMRGGWGCARILDLVDYNTIAANPKVLMGFSDITSLLIAIYTKTGLASFHGPVGYSSWNQYSTEYVKKILIEGRSNVLLTNHSRNISKLWKIRGGIATGKLIGGNLTVVTSLLGSAYLPDWHDKILFVEETEEEVYRIDRMLTQLKLAGVLNSIKGFVFGICNKCEPKVPDESLNIQEMLTEHLKPLRIPVLVGANFGHTAYNYTLPIGVNAKLDADAGTIQILQAAVR